MTMNKDKWALAKKGATVKFRCGGTIILESYANETDTDPFTWFITILGTDYYYTDNGRFIDLEEVLHPFDIIDITPEPEVKRHEWVVIPFYVSETEPMRFKITYTEDQTNPDPTIEVVK